MKLPFLKHFLALALVIFGGIVQGQTSHIQFANNSADPELASVDIWIDTVKLVDNLSFRMASDPIEVASSQLVNILILDSSSIDTLSFDSMLVDSFSYGASYLLMLEGLMDSVNYSPFEPYSIKKMRRQEQLIASYTSVMFHLGATDATALQVDETRRGLGNLIDSISYGQSTDYISLESDDYRLRTYANSQLLSELELKLLSIGLIDSSVIVVGSGFLDPAANNNGPSFKWQYIPDHQGSFVSLKNSTAHLQVIHNSANPALSRLDVYSEDQLFKNNLNFRSKTGLREVSSALDVILGFATDSSSGPGTYIVKDTLNLEADHYYRAVLNGVSGFNFTPNKELEISLIETGAVAENPAKTDLRVVQGATDVTTFNLRETDLLNTLLIGDLPYGTSSDVIDLPAADYKIRVRDLNDTLDQDYALPLFSNNLQGASLLLVASGFLDTLGNGNGEYFGMWLADTNSGPMTELSKALGIFTEQELELTIHPNPVDDFLWISTPERIDRATLLDLHGREILSFPGQSGMNKFDLSELARGSYLIRVHTSDKILTERVVKL